jgi:hypothetical protein
MREGNKLVLTAQPYSYYTTTPDASAVPPSDHFIVIDLSANSLDVAYDQPTKASSLRMMGTQKDRAFLNLQGDGIVVVDTSKPCPRAVAQGSPACALPVADWPGLATRHGDLRPGIQGNLGEDVARVQVHAAHA